MLLGVCLGALYPEIVPTLRWWIPIVLFFIIFPMMTNLQVEKVKQTVRKPKSVGFGIILNLLVAPLAMGALVYLFLSFGLYPNANIAVGLLLYGAMPCGGIIVAFTAYGKGNVELATLIVSLNFLLAIILVPLWAYVLIGVLLPVPLEIITEVLACIILIPLATGVAVRRMLIRKYGAPKYMKLRAVFPIISMSAIYLMVVLVFWLGAKTLLQNPWAAAGVLLTAGCFYALMLALSTLSVIFLQFNYEDSVALVFSTSTGSPAVAVALAIIAFTPPTSNIAAMTIIIGGTLLQTPTMIGYLRLLTRLRPLFGSGPMYGLMGRNEQ
jgi:ACR3 family arsenite efflux pump ArsB